MRFSDEMRQLGTINTFCSWPKLEGVLIWKGTPISTITKSPQQVFM